MLLELLVSCFFGIVVGIFTGLAPGIHVNLVAATAVAIFPGFGLDPMIAAVLIISVAMTHTFLDSLPSIFLGAPDADVALAVLPGHRLLLEGKGALAVRYMVVGSILAIVWSILLSPFFVLFLMYGYSGLQIAVPFIILGISAFLILRDSHKGAALFLFLASGVLGFVSMQVPMSNVLFPLLSGFFGAATLLESLRLKPKIPGQKECKLDGKHGFPGFIASIGGGVTGIFPGVGSSAAAGMASAFWKKITPESFLVLVGGINTANFFMSLWSYVIQDRARNGAIVGVRELIGPIGWSSVIVFAGASLIAAGVSALLTLKLSSWFARLVPRMPYQEFCLGVIILLLLLTFFLSGWLGLVVFMASTALGMVAPFSGCARQHAMGCILLPVAIFLLT